jgi:DNA-binding SARP family transcriptional activator
MYWSVSKPDEQQLLKYIEPYPLILLLPRLRTRDVLLASLAGKDTYLYSPQPGESNLVTFLGGVAESLLAVNPGSGHQIRDACARRPLRPKALVRAFLSDLAQLGPHLLVLDALDYLHLDDAVHNFFHQLLAQLPSGLKVVINTRQLPRRFWSTSVRFSPDLMDRPYLEIYALDGGAVYVDGLPVRDWEGPLVRHLFYFLVDHSVVTRDEIFEAFWPRLSVREATNVFHVTKRKISDSLGHELTDYSGSFYGHTTQLTVHYDVALFEQAVTQADQALPDQALRARQQAVQLYRLPFLYRMNMPWIRQRREQLKHMYTDTLIQIGRCYQAQANDDLAGSFFLRAQREYPEREDVCRSLMTLYRGQNQVARAAMQYELLQDRLQTRLGIVPSKATQTLYSEIVRNTR